MISVFCCLQKVRMSFGSSILIWRIFWSQVLLKVCFPKAKPSLLEMKRPKSWMIKARLCLLWRWSFAGKSVYSLLLSSPQWNPQIDSCFVMVFLVLFGNRWFWIYGNFFFLSSNVFGFWWNRFLFGIWYSTVEDLWKNEDLTSKLLFKIIKFR